MALVPRICFFHFGIIATLKIPFANIACLGASVLVFRNELVARVVGRKVQPEPLTGFHRFNRFGALSLLLVTLLSLQVLSEVRMPSWRFQDAPTSKNDTGGLTQIFQSPVHTVLWAVGVAQSYRLLDWIDTHNFHVTYDMTEHGEDEIEHFVDPNRLFPPTMRSILLQSYVHDINWRKFPDSRSGELKLSLLARFSNRFCRSEVAAKRFEVYQTIDRITRDNANLSQGRRELLMQFECNDGHSKLSYVRLEPSSVWSAQNFRKP